MKIFPSILIALAVFISSRSFSQPGTLDSTFGEDGKVITHFGIYRSGGGFSSALQPDGKIVVAGASSTLSRNGDFAVARYQTNGELDSSFGVDGKILTDLNDSSDRASSVNVLDDGKILVTGLSVGRSRIYFVMVRYTSNGIIDSSFGVDGKVISDLSAGGHNVAILPDKKILVDANVDLDWPNSAYFLARFNSNGQPDSSFGVNGLGDTMYFKDAFSSASLALQNDGKIVVGGSAGVTEGDGSYFEMVRFKADGTTDNDFGTRGKVTTFYIGEWAHMESVLIQDDGKIIAAGDRYSNDPDFALVRYKSNGELDSAFGTNGKVFTDFGNYDRIYSIATQADGKIVAAGYSRYTSYDFALARYTENGRLDSSFGLNGKVTTDFANGIDIGYSICVQADGKLIVAGQSNNDFALARYNNDEVLPVSIIDLKAYSVGSNVKIEWTALNELNISQYNIERSIDCKKFNVIGNVKALANGQQKIEYSFIDHMPAGGDNFYRIKSFSKDGAAKYTNTVKVNFASGVTAFVISPNPVKDILQIQGLSSSIKTISLLDVKGKVLQQVTTSNGSYSCNVKKFTGGIYFVRIVEGVKTATLKFIRE